MNVITAAARATNNALVVTRNALIVIGDTLNNKSETVVAYPEQMFNMLNATCKNVLEVLNNAIRMNSMLEKTHPAVGEENNKYLSAAKDAVKIAQVRLAEFEREISVSTKHEKTILVKGSPTLH